MKMYEIGTTILVIGLFVLLGVGFISQKYLGKDNKIEQTIEEIIKEKTGLDVDLSQEEKENKQ